MSKRARSIWEIYRWPLLLAVIIMVGLLSALLGDGIWNALSWVLLAIPCCVIVCCIFVLRHRRDS